MLRILFYAAWLKNVFHIGILYYQDVDSLVYRANEAAYRWGVRGFAMWSLGQEDMVFCGDYGELYRRVHWNNHGCKSIVRYRSIKRLLAADALAGSEEP